MGEHDLGHVLGADADGSLDVDAMFWAQRAALPRNFYEGADATPSPDEDKKTKDILADTALDSNRPL